MRRAVLALCGLALLAASCAEGAPQSTPVADDPTPFATAAPETVVVAFGDATITAEVVADSAGRQLGLMNRTELGADAGMLFLFPRPDEGGFWMKNTLIPLQIAYMRTTAPGTFEVLVIKDMVPCTTKDEDCTIYDPEVVYDAALEVNDGWFDRHEVRAGSMAETEGELPKPL